MSLITFFPPETYPNLYKDNSKARNHKPTLWENAVRIFGWKLLSCLPQKVIQPPKSLLKGESHHCCSYIPRWVVLKFFIKKKNRNRLENEETRWKTECHHLSIVRGISRVWLKCCWDFLLLQSFRSFFSFLSLQNSSRTSIRYEKSGNRRQFSHFSPWNYFQYHPPRSRVTDCLGEISCEKYPATVKIADRAPFCFSHERRKSSVLLSFSLN